MNASRAWGHEVVYGSSLPHRAEFVHQGSSPRRWPLFSPRRAIIELNGQIPTGGSMYFKQFYLGCLAHASYLIGSDGEAAVVDPQRDVDQYVEEARRQGMKIKYVVETHLHADFVSGHHELAERTGAQIYLGAGSGATFPHSAVKDGDAFQFGDCRFEFLQTPGHTLESICIAMTDLEDAARPRALFTGDTLFVGDVGRPDLSHDHTPPELAVMLYHSLHDKLLGFPDETEVFPAHGAGSLCGRQMG